MQQIGPKGVQEQILIGREGDSLGIMQRLNFGHTNELYVHWHDSVLENET